ncbi:MAG: outer membrane protein assembly factor BamB family protein [Candidatus Odinarchaeia archaeon]
MSKRSKVFSAMLIATFAISLLTGTMLLQQAQATDWPMFRYDSSHSGYTNTSGLDAATKLWNYTTDYAIFSSPAVVNGKVYIGSHDDNVYCLDASTGEKIWNYTTGDNVLSSPTVANGKVYVGSYDKNVYCLDASTGSKIWNYTTGNIIWSSPIVVNGKVYIGSDDDNVYCLDALTGSKIWNYTTDGDVASSPTVIEGKVYVAGGSNIYCLNASTGTKIWNYTTGDLVASSPAVVNGRLYVGSYDNNVYCLKEITPPIIVSLTHTPINPTGADSVTILANVSDACGIIEVILSYHNGTAWNNVTMTYNSTTGYYEAVIPALPEGTTVQYKVYAEDANYNWNQSSVSSYTVSSALNILLIVIPVAVIVVIAIVAVIFKKMRS